jgi:hypothetical protein
LVEHELPKLGVAGSNPVSRSEFAEKEPKTKVPSGETSGDSTTVDAIEVALAHALTAASHAGQWDIVALLARELAARRLERSAPNVVDLDTRRPPR